jgi:hypothetical protein
LHSLSVNIGTNLLSGVSRLDKFCQITTKDATIPFTYFSQSAPSYVRQHTSAKDCAGSVSASQIIIRFRPKFILLISLFRISIYCNSKEHRVCLVRDNFFCFSYCSTFVYICQLVSNHELIRLKRSVLWFSTKLCN